jgi:hypothetical protein
MHKNPLVNDHKEQYDLYLIHPNVKDTIQNILLPVYHAVLILLVSYIRVDQNNELLEYEH